MELHEIEYKIACNKMNGAQVFTQMKQHIPSNLIKQLNEIIVAVFDNEKEFMQNIWRPMVEYDELIDFYMASERCRLSVLLPDGVTITDTVKTVDVIDWFNDLKQ